MQIPDRVKIVVNGTQEDVFDADTGAHVPHVTCARLEIAPHGHMEATLTYLWTSKDTSNGYQEIDVRYAGAALELDIHRPATATTTASSSGSDSSAGDGLKLARFTHKDDCTCDDCEAFNAIDWRQYMQQRPLPPGERTTHFVMSSVDAPSDTPVLFVRVSGGMLSLARLEDVERLVLKAREATYDEVQDFVGAHEFDTSAGRRIYDFITNRLADLKEDR